MKLVIIAAITKDRVIGRDNRIPWHIKEDLVRLSKMLRGNVVIQGRKTYDSMLEYYTRSGKKSLSKRTNIVITSNPDYEVAKENGFVVSSPEEAIKRAKQITGEDDEVFIIGGAKIFEQMIGKADRLYLTVIKDTHFTDELKGDAYFPDYSNFTKVISRIQCKNIYYRWEYLTLER